MSPRDDNSPAARTYRRGPSTSSGQVPSTGSEQGSPNASRRDFLKVAGFSVAAMAVGGCSRAAEHEAVPLLDRPEETAPGRSDWYATLCDGCGAGCGVLARSRHGRPIKIEGNREHPLSAGGTCAIGQAGVLSLYDTKRLGTPRSGGKPSRWEDVDAAIGEKLAVIRSNGGRVRLLSSTVNGPTRRKAIADFLAGFGDGRHVMYDALSAAALLDAHERTFGRRVLPRYRFENARVVVGFDADFLGTWLAPVPFTGAYQKGRVLKRGTGEAPPANADGKEFSRHIQFESRMSLTGASADERIVLAPADFGIALTNLAVFLGRKAGKPVSWKPAELPGTANALLRGLADELWRAPRGRTLVVCGTNRIADQTLTALINHQLGNYGTAGDTATIDLESHSNQRLGDDVATAALIDEMEAGKVAALFLAGCNPAYDLPDAARFAAALEKVGLVVNFADHDDETAALSTYVCPDHHYLESWNDAESVAGLVTVSQPVIRPLGKSRAFTESLHVWSGAGGKKSALELMQAAWRREVHPRQLGGDSFERFWNRSVHDGFTRVTAPAPTDGPPMPAFRVDGVVLPTAAPPPPDDGLVVLLYPKVALLDGRHAHNPWLQELPDPISKVAWDNYAAFAPETAERKNIAQGDLVELVSEDGTLTLPAFIQPGQHPGIVAIALGYGRRGTDRFADIGPEWIEGKPTLAPGQKTVGVNAAPFLWRENGHVAYEGLAVTVKKTYKERALASTQLYHSLTVPANLAMKADTPRPIVLEDTLDGWRTDTGEDEHGHHPSKPLWDDDHEYKGHHWGLAIDLSACTGCSACVIACQAENNIPVVGRDEVRRKREMHWLRIDRYYAGEGTDVDVVHQPMMCQHCDNAPCETVCPVLATMHSSEGLNQQVYNRCVGTRYCSNNCPYKVRRFNWFNYLHESELENMVFNPDVTVRTRGVMEKCTFCVQRIQEGKLRARREDRPVADGDIRPACVQSCPAGAMVFGDTNDEKSRVAERIHETRTYRVLEELDVRPSVHYMARVRNRAEEKGKGGKSHD